MGSDGVEFVREIRLNEGDLFWNRIAHQIMLEGVVVKQEDIRDEIKYPVTESIAVGGERRNETSPLNSSEEHPKPMSKVIQHRRCARIGKLNSVAIRRHLLLRPAQTIEATQDDFNRKDVNSIHGEMQGNDFSQIRDSNHSHTLHGMPCATASQTHMESAIIGSMKTNDAGNPQIDGAENGNVANTPTFESMDMEVAQYVQIESNGSATNAIGHIMLNRCEACVQTFKTPKNLAKHLQSKKHEKKMMRLGKQK